MNDTEYYDRVIAAEKEVDRLDRALTEEQRQGMVAAEGYREKIAALTKALETIAKGQGRFSTDHKQHAINTVQDAIETAKYAIRGEVYEP